MLKGSREGIVEQARLHSSSGKGTSSIQEHIGAPQQRSLWGSVKTKSARRAGESRAPKSMNAHLITSPLGIWLGLGLRLGLEG